MMTSEQKDQVQKDAPAPDLIGEIKKSEQSLADQSPAIIRDHKFRPKGAWYTLCDICNLAESAHEATELRYVIEDDEMAVYDDD